MKNFFLLICMVFLSANKIPACSGPLQQVDTAEEQHRQLSKFEQLSQWSQQEIAQYLSDRDLSALIKTSRAIYNNLKKSLDNRQLLSYWTTGKIINEAVLRSRQFPGKLVFSADDTKLASTYTCKNWGVGQDSGDVTIWDVQEKAKINELSVNNDTVLSIAFAPDGIVLACGTDCGTIILWNIQTDEIRQLTGHTSTVESLAFSPDGKLLASGAKNGTIRLWDVQTGEKVYRLTGHKEYGVDKIHEYRLAVRSLAFSPDGKFLASGDAGSSILLWNIPTGQGFLTHYSHNNGNMALSFFAHGTLLAAFTDRWVISYSRKYKSVLFFTEFNRKKVNGYIDWQARMALSPDGTLLISCGKDMDSIIKFWNVQTGNMVKMFTDANPWPILPIALSTNGKLLASGKSDGTIGIWKAVHNE